jgi:hypothetical protein
MTVVFDGPRYSLCFTVGASPSSRSASSASGVAEPPQIARRKASGPSARVEATRRRTRESRNPR